MKKSLLTAVLCAVVAVPAFAGSHPKTHHIKSQHVTNKHATKHVKHHK